MTSRSSYIYADSTFALTETDGVRVYSSDVADFIQKVPCKPVS